MSAARTALATDLVLVERMPGWMRGSHAAAGNWGSRAFERAGERALREWEQRGQSDHEVLAPLPSWWRPIRCAQVLRTRAALVSEGREMGHCVSTYEASVGRRNCVIVSLAIRDVTGCVHRSTLELSPAGVIIQHKGRSNEEPPKLCERAAHVIVKRATSKGSQCKMYPTRS